MNRTVIQPGAPRRSIDVRTLAAALLALLCGATLDRAVAQPSIAPLYGVETGVEREQADSPTLDHRRRDDSSSNATVTSAIAVVVARDRAATTTPELPARALVGGQFDRNPNELDPMGNLAAEQRYARDSVSAGTTIVEDLTLERIGELRSAHDALELVVRAHLEEELPQADADAAVLWIDVIATGRNGSPMVCRTLAVRAGELMRRSPCESYDRYQQATLALDGSVCNAAVGAARGDQSEARAPASIRVRYAGNATVAIRSIVLRLARPTGDP